MRTAKLKCGCSYELGARERWLELCAPHQADTQATHTRWAAERAARPTLPPFKRAVGAPRRTRK